MAKVYTVHAELDEVAKVWATDGVEIPGLFCEAASFDQLVDIRIVGERHGKIGLPA